MEVMPATIRDYDALITTLRARIDALQISHATLEDIAGLTQGHVGKCLGPAPVKRIGLDTVFLVVPALGMRVVIEQDMDAVKHMERRWEIRDELRRRPGIVRLRFSDKAKAKFAKEMGTLGGSVRKRFRTDQKTRKKGAKDAAKSRWRRIPPADRIKHAKSLNRIRWREHNMQRRAAEKAAQEARRAAKAAAASPSRQSAAQLRPAP